MGNTATTNEHGNETMTTTTNDLTADERMTKCLATMHAVKITPRVAQELSCGFDLSEGLLAKVATAAKRSRTIEVNVLERMELERATDTFQMCAYGAGNLTAAFEKVYEQVVI